MAYTDYQRQVWLINQLQQHLDGMTLREIDEAWRESSLNPEREPYSRFTFRNHRNAIKERYGLEIQVLSGNKYKMAPVDGIMSDTALTLMDKLQLDDVIREFDHLKGRILYERDLRPTQGKIVESEKFRTVVRAMGHNHAIRFHYKPYGRQEEVRTVKPYCIVMLRNRMYVHGPADAYQWKRRTYAMDDRMISVEEYVDLPFKIPASFDAETYFKPAFGIVPETADIKPQEIELRATASVADYLRSVKLHASQQEVRTEGPYTFFKYNFAPTIDFYEELFRHRGQLVISTPRGLALEALELIDKMKQGFESAL